LEGTPFSRLRQQMAKYGYNKDVDIVLGTVTSPPPALKVRIDNEPTEIEAEDLIVSEHLTRHKRIVTINHTEKTQRNLGDGIAEDHLDTDDLAAPYTSFSYNYVEMQFEDVLKANDRVILAECENGQTYVILDRAVKYV
jgi:hypothetical protein